MPLPVPVLDDRSWQDLRDELLRRIPVYTPEWTDWGPSDPGVTLLELVAFLGENLLFRFNQIPEATQLHLLRLLHVPLRPAVPAHGIVVFEVDPPTSAPHVEEGNTAALAGDVAFEVEDDVTVLPVSVVAAVKTARLALGPGEQALVAQRAIDARDGLRKGEKAAYYVTDLVGDDETALGAPARDVRHSVDGSLWIAVVPAEGVDGAAMLAPGGLLAPSAGERVVVNLGFARPLETTTMQDVDPCFGELASRPEDDRPSRPQVEWRVSTKVAGDDGEPEYVGLELVSDSTWGLTRDGVVRLRLPADLSRIGAPDVVDPDLAGTGELPPPLEDEPPVLFWIRAFPAPGAPPLETLQWVGVNAARVTQASAAAPEFVASGTGMPTQQYALAHRDVLADTLVVQVEAHDQWKPWRRVDSFAASGPTDRHFVVDAESGVVTFGDTVRGLAPQDGQRIRALQYRHGGGARGNVAAKAIAKVDSTGLPGAMPPPGTVAVSNPLPTAGGADAEDLADGLRRIPGELRRRDRAVTASDFRELALATPGGQVGRAECLPIFHPQQRGVPAAGVVTVVVWPREDHVHPDAPRPDTGVLRAVCDFLERRRLVTTELYVVPPEYKRIAVSVSVEPKPGASPDAVRRWVERVIRQYLSPLPPYGPEGGGWPLGRDVRAAELEAAALQVDGVLYLNGLEVGGLSEEGQSWEPGTVVLEPWEVVEVAAVTVVAGGPVPPLGTDLDPPSPDEPSRPIPIPVPKDVC